jgi:hypothetical protein
MRRRSKSEKAKRLRRIAVVLSFVCVALLGGSIAYALRVPAQKPREDACVYTGNYQWSCESHNGSKYIHNDR